MILYYFLLDRFYANSFRKCKCYQFTQRVSVTETDQFDPGNLSVKKIDWK